MKDWKLKYKPLGSIAALIEWPERIDPNILNDINFLKKQIEKEMKEVIIDMVPAYNSLAVFFYTDKIRYSSVIKKIDKLYEQADHTVKISKKIWKIPVCYDKEFGQDLLAMSEQKKIPVKEIIRLHSSVIYDVYFIGFLPGFLYLGGLDEKLYTRRKPVPRQMIEKGSVGIAEGQTGIYPRESPGGWNIIGRSPVEFFTVENDPPCFAVSGDRLQFYPVTKTEYKKIEKEVRSGTYSVEYETNA